MPCCGAEPAGAPAILTQRAARGKSGRLWRRSSRGCRRRLMSGNLSLPSGKLFSQQAERRGIALLAALSPAPRTPKTRETSILTKTTILGVPRPYLYIREGAFYAINTRRQHNNSRHDVRDIAIQKEDQLTVGDAMPSTLLLVSISTSISTRGMCCLWSP